MKRRLAVLTLALCALVIAPMWVFPVRAQDRSVVVERRDGEISVQENGDVVVEETWQVRFIGGPFRFAFRTIPLNRVEEISDWQVSEDGQAYQQAANEAPNTFNVVEENGDITTTWYFPPTTDQTRAFQLRYLLRGALRIYEDGDQFFWKFIESDRQYTIEASRVVVNLPGSIASNQIRTTAYLNALEQGAGEVTGNNTVVFTGGPFGPGEEWEIRTLFPHGIVTAQPTRWQQLEDRQPVLNLIALVVAILTLIGGFLGLYLLWYNRGRDFPADAVAEYLPKPPEALPPAIAGTLLDERADMQDILATLVDLAKRGHLRIIEQTEQGFLRSTQTFTFERLTNNDDQLRPFEGKLINAVFGNRNQRELADLKEKFYTKIPELQRMLYDEAVKAGYFHQSPDRTRNMYMGFGCVSLLGVGGFTFLAVITLIDIVPLIILVCLAAGIVALGFLVLGRAMPRKTQQGANAAAKWRAFRRYLEHIDRYSDLEAAKDQFNEYLPYAIAFGLERDWVRKFERVNTPAPIWYHPYPYGGYYGPHGSSGDGDHGGSGGSTPSVGAPSLDSMTNRSFGGLNAMSSGFFGMLSAASSTFTSTPASSGSGGGGGGFSGGGGGGGGGGGSSGFG